MSDFAVSLGGVLPSGVATSEVFYSSNGLSWSLAFGGMPRFFSPNRFFSSCDVDESGLLFVIGGHSIRADGQHFLLNDVWQNDARPVFGSNLITASAPFSPREEHLVLVADNSFLKTDIIYVMGGQTTCMSCDCSDGVSINDVWASSDGARSWTAVNTRPPWGPRWGHSGIVTTAGVLLVFGGLHSMTGLYQDTVTYRDMWASFDGGLQWCACSLPPNKLFIRGEQGVAINGDGRLVITAGYSYAENGTFQMRFNDVYRSTFSVENPQEVARRCGGADVIPATGIGLRAWPGAVPVSPNNVTFSPVIKRAPWSQRTTSPGLYRMTQPRTITNPTDGSTASTGPNWLLLYGGAGNENDVYASADDGVTWTLIAGISSGGVYGRRESAHPLTSFPPTFYTCSCEDPGNDDVYQIGGADVWYSSDAMFWTLRSGSPFAPGRNAPACVVDSRSRVLVVGGYAIVSGRVELNDVWSSESNSKGQTWVRMTANAPFPGRSHHRLQATWSDRYDTDLLFITGGGALGRYYNDVNRSCYNHPHYRCGQPISR